MTRPLLEIRNACRGFATPEGSPVTALDGIDLTVGDGEFVTLLGPSGCGKTTLLRAVAGFERLDAGTILLDGADLTGLPPHRRPVNTVFQSYALFPHMTVARNVGYALEVRGVSRRQRQAEIDAALERVSLSGFGKRMPAQLSGGQRQRVALARAIVARPRLLLLDEPLSALDRNLRRQMQVELKELQHRLGIAFVFVTHDQEEALTLSDRIAVMDHGRIAQTGTPRDIWRRPRNRFVAGFVGEANLLDAVVTPAGLEMEGGQILAAQTDLPVGRRVTAMLRPDDLSLAAHGIAARVLRTSYTGNGMRVAVLPDGATTEILLHAADGCDPQPGDAVFLGHDPARVHILDGPE